MAKPQNDPSDRCPVCGESVQLTGHTTDGRLIGSCGDAFTTTKWLACAQCGDHPKREGDTVCVDCADADADAESPMHPVLDDDYDSDYEDQP